MEKEKANQLKKKTRKIMIKDIGEALIFLKQNIPDNHLLLNKIIQLEARLNEINNQNILGIITNDYLQLEYNKIRSSLLEIIDSIDQSIYEKKPKDSKGKIKKGSVLYQVPKTMELNKETRCRVRLAFKEEYIKKNIELTEDTKIKSIRIAEIMEVDIIDPSNSPAFIIRFLSTKEQFIDADDFTEWQYMITPVKEGEYPLLLKITLIEIYNNKERKKEVVLEEKVKIITKPSNIQSTFKEYPHKYNKILKPSKKKSNIKLSFFRRILALNIFLFVLVSGIFATNTPERIRWIRSKKINNVNAYTKYIDKYSKSGLFYEDAKWQIMLLNDTLAGYISYIDEFPNNKYLVKAKQKIDSINAIQGIENNESLKNSDVNIEEINPVEDVQKTSSVNANNEVKVEELNGVQSSKNQYKTDNNIVDTPSNQLPNSIDKVVTPNTNIEKKGKKIEITLLARKFDNLKYDINTIFEEIKSKERRLLVSHRKKAEMHKVTNSLKSVTLKFNDLYDKIIYTVVYNKLTDKEYNVNHNKTLNNLENYINYLVIYSDVLSNQPSINELNTLNHTFHQKTSKLLEELNVELENIGK